MKLAIMQPYLFPYLGYFQLINTVDSFVLLDDVNYINRGWINRNRVLVNSEAKFFTLALNKASQNRLISELKIVNDGKNKKRIIDLLSHNYKKAPYYKNIIGVLEEIIFNKELNLAKYIFNSIIKIMDFLDIETKILMSSGIEKVSDLKSQMRIIDIAVRLGADEYVNMVGGRDLYCSEAFCQKNIKLRFLNSRRIFYNQFGGDFIPDLSIIDVFMFNPIEKIKEFLERYRILKEGDVFDE